MRALRRLRRWFLGPAPATALGILRIVCVARGVVQLPRLVEFMESARELPTALRPQPAHLPAPWPPPTSWGTPIEVAAWVAGIAALLGVGTRLALAAFFFLLGYLTVGTESLGTFDHSVILPLQVLPVLALCPGADALSIDAWFRRRRTGAPSPTLVPRWGLATVLLLVSSVYLTSGVSKLRWSEGRWADGQTLARYFAGASSDLGRQMHAAVDAPGPGQTWKDGVGLEHHLYICRSGPLSRSLAARQRATQAISVFAILAECAMPLLLLSRRRRNAGLLVALGFHNGIGVLMGLPFWNYQAVLAALTDVRRLGRTLAGRVDSARAVVLFDGTCGLCDRTVDLLLRHDRGGRFRFAALQSPAGARVLAQNGLPADWLGSLVVVADGRALVRSDAALALAARLDGAWRLLCVLRFLPRPVRDAAYDAVAAVRYRVFGRREACRVPTPAERGRFLRE